MLVNLLLILYVLTHITQANFYNFFNVQYLLKKCTYYDLWNNFQVVWFLNIYSLIYLFVTYKLFLSLFKQNTLNCVYLISVVVYLPLSCLTSITFIWICYNYKLLWHENFVCCFKLSQFCLCSYRTCFNYLTEYQLHAIISFWYKIYIARSKLTYFTEEKYKTFSYFTSFLY